MMRVATNILWRGVGWRSESCYVTDMFDIWPSSIWIIRLGLWWWKWRGNKKMNTKITKILYLFIVTKYYHHHHDMENWRLPKILCCRGSLAEFWARISASMTKRFSSYAEYPSSCFRSHTNLYTNLLPWTWDKEDKQWH